MRLWCWLCLLLFTEGFDCRCGNLFCAIHRYSDKHDCPYDYRSAAAARIRKENPIVVAEKIQKLWGLSAKKESLTLWIWTMVTWMKTPDIMASFVHGSLRRVGWGVRLQPLSRRFPNYHLPLSPIVTAAEPECFMCVGVCADVCLYDGVCVHLLESRGESRRGLADKSVAVGREGIWFYPFLFLNFGDRVSLFLYNPCKVVEMRWG